MTTNQTPVDLLKQLIRQHKSSIFLRHSVASEKDLTAVAELLLQEVVRPYLELLRDKTMRGLAVTHPPGEEGRGGLMA